MSDAFGKACLCLFLWSVFFMSLGVPLPAAVIMSPVAYGYSFVAEPRKEIKDEPYFYKSRPYDGWR